MNNAQEFYMWVSETSGFTLYSLKVHTHTYFVSTLFMTVLRGPHDLNSYSAFAFHYICTPVYFCSPPEYELYSLLQ